jgi:hypothetical protein
LNTTVRASFGIETLMGMSRLLPSMMRVEPRPSMASAFGVDGRQRVYVVELDSGQGVADRSLAAAIPNGPHRLVGEA